MEIVNDPGFVLGWMIGQIRTRELSAAMAVKATFRLRPGAPAEPAAEQEPLSADVHYDDDPEQSLRYEADLGLFKPRTDLLVAGTCHAPGGRPTSVCRAGFRVGRQEKTVAVIGDRVWRRKLFVTSMSEPAAFRSLSIRDENAFGGPGYEPNPVGKGYRGDVLPNVEDPRSLVRSPDDRPPPVGFGPIPRTARRRASKAGTYRRHWLEDRWPWLPDDFDWTYFNAAPEDQQVEGYLRGDEEIAFENLHPERPSYVSRLPGLRCRLFLDVKDGERSSFREVPLVIDTLWADPAAETLVLIWRGVTPVRSHKLTEIRAAYIAAEPLASGPLSIERYESLLPIRLAEEEEGEDGEGKEAPEAPGGDVPEEGAASEEEERREKEAEAAEREDGERELAELDGEFAQIEADAAKQLDAVKAELESAGLDPALVDAAPAALAPGELSAAYAAHLDLLGPAEAARLPPLEEIERMDRDLSSMDAEETAGEEPSEEREPEPWSRESSRAHHAAGGSFEGQELDGLDLSGLDFSGARFAGATMSGCRLRDCAFAGADFSGADLSRADLSGSDLTRACLKDADVSGARCDRAKLAGARLDLADLEGSTLVEADLTGAAAPYADFSGADLTSAVLVEACIDDADFSGAKLENADLRKTSASGIVLDGAKARGIRMEGACAPGLCASEGADLTGGRFGEIVAPRSVWEEVLLDDADFRGASLDHACFNGSSLLRADLSLGSLKHATFAEARLQEAHLSRVNLFRGSLEKADLTGADLRDSNLYEVELYQAIARDVKLAGANLKGTKLA